MIDLTAIVLAGGKGERLKPFTERFPKPLVPLNGQPILHYLLSYLAANNGLLIINFDEGSTPSGAAALTTPTDFTCSGCASLGVGGRTGAVLISPRLPQGATVTTGYDHYSLLRTIEDSFGISEHLNLAGAATAMTDAFAGTAP